MSKRTTHGEKYLLSNAIKSHSHCIMFIMHCMGLNITTFYCSRIIYCQTCFNTRKKKKIAKCIVSLNSFYQFSADSIWPVTQLIKRCRVYVSYLTSTWEMCQIHLPNTIQPTLLTTSLAFIIPSFPSGSIPYFLLFPIIDHGASSVSASFSALLFSRILIARGLNLQVSLESLRWDSSPSFPAKRLTRMLSLYPALELHLSDASGQ